MIKQIITVIILIIVAFGVFTLAKTITPQKIRETPQGKLPAGSTPVGAPSDIEGTWVWSETIVNNDTSVTPKKPDAFSITLTDGQVTGTTDCNSFFSSYKIGSDGVIFFGPIGSTKMACEGSQEGEFTDLIAQTSNYTFDNGNLVLFQQDASVTIFKKSQTKDVTLGIGDTATVDTLAITLNKFVQDSRCPIDVTCIQAGAVTVNVTLTQGSTTLTKNFPSDEAPQVFGDYKIAIKEIAPARESKKEINPKDYKITFHVEK
jgi:heat shock protein HslJ